MNAYSWVLIPALMIACGLGITAHYRTRSDRTPLSWAILAFSVFTFALLFFYVVQVNPYPEPRSVTLTFAGFAAFLLLLGTGFVVFVPNAALARLSPAEVRALLPESIVALSPIEMRTLVPERFRSHATQEIYTLVMVQISRMSPDQIRRLTPESLQAELRRAIPHSILDAK